MTPNKEHNLLRRLSEGDETAFRELFESYYPRVRTFVACIVKEERTAEDVAQDLFVKIWERRESFGREVASFGGYIYRMARNAALNEIRRTVNLNLDDARLSESLSDGASEEEAYYAREKELFIKLVVCRMPEQRRRIFEMSRYLQMDNQAIAEALHLSNDRQQMDHTPAIFIFQGHLSIFFDGIVLFFVLIHCFVHPFF